MNFKSALCSFVRSSQNQLFQNGLRKALSTSISGDGSKKVWTSSNAVSVEPVTSRPKHKPPKRRASTLLSILEVEEFSKLKKDRQWPDILPGDSVQIEQLPYMTSPTTEMFKGLVIAKVNRFSDTAITILNCEYGTPIIRRIKMYNPLMRNITVLQKAFIHKGKKRVRRSKLYYLLDRDPLEYTIK